MFVGKARSLPENIRQGWKGLPGRKTLAYYENPLITPLISFIVQAPGQNSIILFSVRNLLMFVIASLMFKSKVGAYPKVNPLKDDSF
jgi:hypothetical protein